MKIIRAPGAITLLAMLLLLPGTGAQAKRLRTDSATEFKMDISISGTVTANTSCTFNQGGTINVDFGEVKYKSTAGTNTLDGTYRQALSSALTCDGETSGSATMTLSSTKQDGVDFGGHKLMGTLVNDIASSDLAIAFEVNGTVQDINVPFAVNMENPPVLTAELVQVGSGSGLVNDADISASATLTLGFE